MSYIEQLTRQGSLKPRIPNGIWKVISIHGVDYEIYVTQSEHFQTVSLRQQSELNRELEMEENNAILSLEHKGKWLGISSATFYDKCTEYTLVDLEKVINGNGQADDSVYSGGVRGGWIPRHPSTPFSIDFDKEMIKYNDIDEFGEEDGRVKSFTDCFDESVDKKEAHEKLVNMFNKNRTKMNLLSLWLTKWKNSIYWKNNGLNKLKSLLSTDVITLDIKCKGNFSGLDLTSRYETSLFREIKWDTDDDSNQFYRCRLPIHDDPLNELIPRVFFSGFIESIVEIDLTWDIYWNNEMKEDNLRIVIQQNMEEMSPQPIKGETRYKVGKKLPAEIVVE